VGIRVAQVYTQFRSPLQPYLCATSERLRAEGVDLSIYTRAPASGAGGGEAVLLRGPEGVRGLPRAVCGAVAGCGDLARRLREWRALGLRGAFRRWLDLRDLVRQEHDVIHLMNWPLYKLLRPYLIGSGIPFVISFRGYDINVRPLEEPGWKTELKEIFSRAAALHFVSDALRTTACSYGAPREKSVVIRPGVGREWLGGERTQSTRKCLRIFSTGRLVWEKGIELALLTIRGLARRGVPLEYHAAGDGPMRVPLSFWAKNLGVAERVIWHGLLPQDQLREELSMSNAYFHPSVSDALPVGVLEAQAIGLPVVATRVGGIPEAVLDGESGFLFEFGDVYGMADALERLWREPELAAEMGRAGRKFVLERFSVEREAVEWVRLYERVADKGRLGLGAETAASRGAGEDFHVRDLRDLPD
jgi:colanic acid/amylovoran biosynthesis glycosyltransferase